ncbi:MAG: hypothetical protein AAF750_15515 [Planctomycetota bacterium]
MSFPNTPKQSRSRYIGAKVEAAAGTAETLAAADFPLLAYEPQINPEINFAERRPAGIAQGGLIGVTGQYAANVSYSFELRGSGTPGTLPKWAETFFICSGFTNTTAADTSNTLDVAAGFGNQKTCTVADVVDGMTRMATGCMFSYRLSTTTGGVVMVHFTGKGVWVSPTDAAHPSGITHETPVPPRFAGLSTYTLGGADMGKTSRFELNQNATVELRDDASQQSGLCHAYIADQNPTLQIDPETPSVANNDILGDFLSGTSKALALTIGSVAGNIIDITAPAAQYQNPQEQDRRGLHTQQITAGLFNSGTSAVDMVRFVFR